MAYLVALIPPALFLSVLLLTRVIVASRIGADSTRDVHLPAWQVLFINIFSLLLTYWWVAAGFLLLCGLLIVYVANRPPG